VVGPLQLTLAPDFLQKANASGGLPYGVTLPDAAADVLFQNEANELPFVAYLRLCFAWGGFPRLAGRLLSPPARALVDGLRRELLPF
jgi:hypothetical protein